MLESLIAVVVLSVGLIGMASLQISGLRFNRDAFLRSQVTVLIYEVIEQMRIDVDNAIDNAAYSAVYTEAADDVSCNSGDQSVSGTTNCWKVGLRERIPGGVLTITGPSGTDNNEFSVSMAWSDTWRTVGADAPTTSVQTLVVQL